MHVLGCALFVVCDFLSVVCGSRWRMLLALLFVRLLVLVFVFWFCLRVCCVLLLVGVCGCKFVRRLCCCLFVLLLLCVALVGKSLFAAVYECMLCVVVDVVCCCELLAV